MSRTNPDKPKPCRAKRTVLLVGEGAQECAFLRHVKNCFVGRESGLAVKVEDAHGGSPSTVLRQTWKLLSLRSFNRCLVLMDTDRPWPGKPPARVKSTHMTYVAARPCIEGLLLSIVQHSGIVPTSASSEQCKKALYDNYVQEDKRTDSRAYEKHFSRDALIRARKHCRELHTILEHLEAPHAE